MNDKEQLEALGKHFILGTPFDSIVDRIRQVSATTETQKRWNEIGKQFQDGIANLQLETQIKDPNTTTVRNDGGKNRVDLLPITALEEVSRVLTAGASKYGENNWRPGMAWSRCYASCLRHLFAWWRGEDKDPETGLSHLGHAACNIFFLIDYQERKKGTDDRYIR